MKITDFLPGSSGVPVELQIQLLEPDLHTDTLAHESASNEVFMLLIC